MPAAGHGDRHAAAASRVEQGVELGQPGLGRGARLAGAQHAEHPAQLGQAGQRAGPDLAEALHQLRLRIGGLVGRRFGLDRDHRHVVGDHVVQLPGDALPLLEQRALAGVPAFLLLELAHAAAPHPDHDAEEDRDRGQEDSLGHDPGIDEHRPGHGDGRRGGHDPRPAAERHRVQAQAVDECARHRDVRPAERARRDRQARKDDGRRGNRPRAEREPRAQHERRADDEREQDQQARRVVAMVPGVRVGQRRVGGREADQRDDHVGDLDEVVPPAPQPARTRGRRHRGVGHERRREPAHGVLFHVHQRRRADPGTSSPARRICEPIPQ